MKTLYITDLDGTLLNNQIEVTPYSSETINQCIEEGMCFSVATARTIQTVSRILRDIHLNQPIVLMNGSMVYDVHRQEYIHVAKIETEAVLEILCTLHEHDLTGFAYSVKDHKLKTYYESLDTQSMLDFYKERVEKYQKEFIQVASFEEVIDKEITYFCLLDTKDQLSDVYNDLKLHPKLNLAYYRDIYSEELWYLEVYSDQASKYHGIKFLKEYINADRVVGFGDNLNDIPMFEICDEKYAVANAKKELKRMADEVISSNRKNGVAEFLKERCKTAIKRY